MVVKIIDLSRHFELEKQRILENWVLYVVEQVDGLH